MAQNSRFSGAIDDSWLGRLTEEIIEPDLPIIDPHHHMWIRDGNTYLLPELLDDVYSGHNVIATVFEECHSMYRKTGPRDEASLGETEFVTGIAAMGASSRPFTPASTMAAALYTICLAASVCMAMSASIQRTPW